MKAWKHDRLDLANYFFQQLSVEDLQDQVAIIESLVDLLLEMGKSMFEKKRNDDARTWLSRGHDLLENIDLGRMSPDSGELRLCLMHTYGM